MADLIEMMKSFILLLSLATPCFAFTEKDYQKYWCSEQKGTQEYRLKDGTRVDCLTNTHAIEVEYAKKWAESIGQSLYYAEQTGKQAGVLLIIQSSKDVKYHKRLKSVAKKHSIFIWTITPDSIRSTQ